MAFQSGRSVVRMPQLTLQYIGNRRTALSSSCVERVPALYNVVQSQHYSNLVLRYRLSTPAIRRTYAQKAVSRPKAHTGRTTTAAKKAPTTSKTKAAKKPAPKKTTPKAVPKVKSKAKPRIKPKPKPRIKPKPKPAKKKKAKAKPKRKLKKPKKVLTEAQKSALTKKKLKATALEAPHGLPSTTWAVFLTEKMRGARERLRGAAGIRKFGEVTKEAGAEFKQLTPEQVEHYNHITNQNRATNAATYRQWIESHAPIVIYEANKARLHLKRLGGNQIQLQDHRQVKQPCGAYLFFFRQRMQSGDLRGLKVVESARLAAREWRGLAASEKKPFEDLAAQDLARYTQERKTVLNKDVRKPRS